MKKIVFSFILIFSTISVFPQDFEPIFTMGINSGLNYDINAYQIPINDRFYYQYLSRPLQYNIGMDFAVAVTNNLRARIGLNFVNSQYGVNWNVGTPPSETPVDMVQSIQNINYFNISLHLDYLLTKWKKLDIYGSPGLKYEWETSDYINTTLNDGSSTSTNWYFLYPAYPKEIVGASVSLILKYNIGKHLGITLTPDYTFFFRNFVSSNWQYYQRASLNAGFEFRFN
jgi:hypothetical protein